MVWWDETTPITEGDFQRALARAGELAEELPATMLPQGPVHPNYQNLAIRYSYDLINLTPPNQFSLGNGLTWSAITDGAADLAALSPDQETFFQGEVRPLREGATDGVLDNYVRRFEEGVFNEFRIPDYVLSPDQPAYGRGIMSRFAEEQSASRRRSQLFEEAQKAAYAAIGRAFQETRHGLNYQESVAVETPNGVLFISLNFQPNGEGR